MKKLILITLILSIISIAILPLVKADCDMGLTDLGRFRKIRRL